MITIGLMALLTPCYMNICNPAIILILSASRPYSHATQEQFPLISLSRLTPDAARATAEAHGCASSGAAGGTQRPSSRPRICHLCYHIVFSVLPFVLSDICRTEDHKPRGRAPDVSTISTCLFLYVMIYCPLPHQSLWERMGVSLWCTCVAFSPLC